MHFIHGLCVESVLLLLDVTHACRVIATTCSRSMICTYLIISSRTYNSSLIIPKLARSINSLLHVGILTLKLFNFPFNHILHEVFLLAHILSFYYLICFVISRLKVKRILWIAIESVVSDYLMASIWKLRWWLESDATWLPAVVERTWVHVVVKLRRLVDGVWVLDSLSSSTV